MLHKHKTTTIPTKKQLMKKTPLERAVEKRHVSTATPKKPRKPFTELAEK